VAEEKITHKHPVATRSFILRYLNQSPERGENPHRSQNCSPEGADSSG